MKRLQVILIILLVFAFIQMVVLIWQPIRSFTIRIGIIEAILILYGSAIFFTWKFKHIGKVLLSLLALFIIFLFATAKLAPPAREKYIAALVSYENIPYVWGGETKRGIDCSGLIRMALCDVYLSEGKFGAAFHIWFFDAAAKDLGKKYVSILEYRRSYASIREIPEADLKKGCIVVASDIHTFAYIGNNQWIQASPNDDKVTIKNASEQDAYFTVAVELFDFKNEIFHEKPK